MEVRIATQVAFENVKYADADDNHDRDDGNEEVGLFVWRL